MKRQKMKVFALVMAMLLLLPIFAFAQKSDGFFKVNDDYYNRGIGNGFDVAAENFGEYGGFGVSHEDFGAPVESGFLIMIGAGLTYLCFKRNNQQKK